jgi:predicted RNA polymerase sigma factor
MKLPIETDRWYNISKDHRKCTKCKENLIGDEFHYLFICSHPNLMINVHTCLTDNTTSTMLYVRSLCQI